MKKVFTLIALTFILQQSARSQDTVSYIIRFPNGVHHEADITVTLENTRDEEVTVTMSKSSPGRYSIHNFGKNIYGIKAYRDSAFQYEIERIEPDSWKIKNVDRAVSVNYTLFANHANGTYSGIDRDFAVLNMPASLMWFENKEYLPVKVKFDLQDSVSWDVATQLHLLDSTENIYFAPSFQYLMDSPCLLGDLVFKEFYTDPDSAYHIRLAFNTSADEAEYNLFAEMAKKIVNEQKEVFGAFPDFYDGTYTFLCSYGPGNYGDGMEHRNSTMLTEDVILTDNLNAFISSVSHEFFHAWNIERIRPASLEPFDFTEANMSGELWFGEGFTNYYGDLVLCRSGIIDQYKYLGLLSAKLNYFLNAPGSQFGSPVYMSQTATFSDRSSAVDEDNFANTYISYYNYGEMIALAMDLSLRSKFKEKTLDDFMQAVWEKYGVNEIPYSNADLQNTLAEVCGDPGFAAQFFESYVFGNEMPDYASMFEQFGYKLIKKNPNKPSLGYVIFNFVGDTAVVLSDPLIGSALYDAGVNNGDLILSIDDQPVTSYPELNFIVGTRKIGDEIDIVYSHYGKAQNGTFKLKEDNQLILIPKETFSMKVTEAEEQNRKSWLDSKIKP